MRALIIGGGPAGAAAAIRLCQAGIPPVLIERSSGPRDVVCGGFLGWDALRALDQLNIDPYALGARPIHRMRIIAGRRVAEARLPYEAAGLSRRVLDAAMLAKAAECGASIQRGARAVSMDLAGRTVRLRDGGELGAGALILATGKHELRGAVRRAAPEPADAVGLRAALAPDSGAGLEGVVELHLFGGGYAGLLLQEDGAVNFCISVTGRLLAEAGGIAPTVEALEADNPYLSERIAGVRLDFESIAGAPYGWRTREAGEGVFRVGDQAAVIASLAGDGVAIALTSGMGAAAALAAGGAAGAASFQRRFSRRAAGPLRAAGLLRAIAEGPMRVPATRFLSVAPQLAGLASRATRIS